MKSKSLIASLAVAAGLLIGGPAFAHHGTSASYDMNKPMQVTGTVTEFIWANPHARLFIDVTDASGKTVNWGIEMRPAPNGLTRAGWTRHTLKAGDKITITVFPSKFGTPTGVGEVDYPVMLNGTQIPGTGGGRQGGGVAQGGTTGEPAAGGAGGRAGRGQ